MKKQTIFRSLIAILALLTSASVFAGASVAWNTPAEGSTYAAGTVLGLGQPDGPIKGIASGVGTVGSGSGLDLMLVIDVSGSMGGSRLAAAKTAAKSLLDSLPDGTTQVGLVRFNSSASTFELLQDLTSNRASLKTSIDALVAGGGTAIHAGIAAATTELTSARHIASHTQMMVVLSDGFSSAAAANSAASAANAAGITVHTVGLPGHDVTLMTSIAANGGGQYTNASDLSALVSIFSGTAGSLVGLDHVDIQLADGTWIYNIATDALGNFILPDQIVMAGVNTFTAYAYGTDGSSASAVLHINGTTTTAPVPEPASLLLFGIGLAGLTRARRRKKQ